jgi:hypothetical protein
MVLNPLNYYYHRTIVKKIPGTIEKKIKKNTGSTWYQIRGLPVNK